MEENSRMDLKEQEMEKGRLLVDMDGTLAKFQPVDTLETLYEKGYFLKLEPLNNVVEAVREIVRNHPEVEVYIMSSVLSDSKYALAEKNAWLATYLPEIDPEHRIFPSCGENKLEHVPGGIREADCLLDDYTHNLMLWEPPAKGIKLLNGINHTHETWKGNMLRYDSPPGELAENILHIVAGRGIIRESRPLEQIVEMANRKYQEITKGKDIRDMNGGYISESERDALVFLREPEARRAMEAGLRICAVSNYADYHGSHKDEYNIWELWKPEQVSRICAESLSYTGERVCLSPFYENATELKKCLEQEVSADKKMGTRGLKNAIQEMLDREAAFDSGRGQNQERDFER